MKALLFTALLFVGIAGAALSTQSRADTVDAPADLSSAPRSGAGEVQPPAVEDAGQRELGTNADPVALSKQSVKACRDRCSAACTRCMKANGKACSATKSGCYMHCN